MRLHEISLGRLAWHRWSRRRTLLGSLAALKTAMKLDEKDGLRKGARAEGTGTAWRVANVVGLLAAAVLLSACTGGEDRIATSTADGSGAAGGAGSGTGGAGGVAGTGGTGGFGGVAGTGATSSTGGTGGTGATGGVPDAGVDAACDASYPESGADGAPLPTADAEPDAGTAGTLIAGGPGCPPHVPVDLEYDDVFVKIPCTYSVQCQSGLRVISMRNESYEDYRGVWTSTLACSYCEDPEETLQCGDHLLSCDYAFDSCPGTHLHCFGRGFGGLSRPPFYWDTPHNGGNPVVLNDCPPARPVPGSYCVGIGLGDWYTFANVHCGYWCKDNDPTSGWTIASCVHPPDAGVPDDMLSEEDVWALDGQCD